ncbi:uncharacterized protein LOC134841493 isoform X2 [Symsagittifera roscoffensis]|uniref:uncharacterized protein LOC134841493 isoform X2 n=1 Tax=Symsagittifera roscoffensis TaxID=84072 RepID=UPI00307C8F8A
MSSDETLAAVLESNSSQNSAIVDTPETSANEIDAPPDLVTCEDHAAVENVMEGLGLGDGDHHAGAGGIDSCAMDALAALSFASGQLFCCRVYQESGGFYHDYSCVQSTLNLETRANSGHQFTFSPFLGAGGPGSHMTGGLGGHSRALSGSQVNLLGGSFMQKLDKSVQTEFTRSYKDEFLRSLAEIEGLKMKTSTLSKELRGIKEQHGVGGGEGGGGSCCGTGAGMGGGGAGIVCHKQCEENLNKVRRALQSREIAVLERDFLCYEYQEQEKVYKKRLCDLEIGIVLGRQNYALKSIACEQVQADAAVKTFAIIMEKRPACMAEFVKQFEESQNQWTKLATELTSLSRETLKFYTNQLRALQENNTQLLELPVLPNISVTTEKGRDPYICLGEFLEHLSTIFTAQSQSKNQPGSKEDSSNSALPNVCANVWNRPEKPSVLAPGSTQPHNIMCQNKHRLPPGLLVPPGFSHESTGTGSHHATVHHSSIPLVFCSAGGGGATSTKNLHQTIFTTASGSSCPNMTRHKLLSSLFSDPTASSVSQGIGPGVGGEISASHVSAHLKHAHRSAGSPHGSRSSDNKDHSSSGVLSSSVGNEGHRGKQQCMCGVCGEPICKILSTRASCNHVFHPKCAIMIDKCPICLK